MDNQVIMEAFAHSTIYTLIFGVLIGSLFSIATLAVFDAIKLARANCTNCPDDAKPAPRAAAKPAAAKTVAKPAPKAPAKAVAKPAAKKAVAKKPVAKPAAKKPVAKKAAPKKKK